MRLGKLKLTGNLTGKGWSIAKMFVREIKKKIVNSNKNS